MRILWTNAPEFQKHCQINDLDHGSYTMTVQDNVSEACQINDLDHASVLAGARDMASFQKPVRSMT